MERTLRRDPGVEMNLVRTGEERWRSSDRGRKFVGVSSNHPDNSTVLGRTQDEFEPSKFGVFPPSPTTTHAANEQGGSVPSYFGVLNVSSDISPLLKFPSLAFPPSGDIPVWAR